VRAVQWHPRERDKTFRRGTDGTYGTNGTYVSARATPNRQTGARTNPTQIEDEDDDADEDDMGTLTVNPTLPCRLEDRF